jgi:hypothetical protein
LGKEVVMLPGEGNRHVAGAAQPEPEIRAQPVSPDRVKRASWWESKLVLLLSGFLLTTVAGTWLQSWQKIAEERRLNRYEDFNWKLTNIRNCYTSLTSLATFADEAKRLALPFLNGAAPDTSSEELEAIAQKIGALQDSSFRPILSVRIAASAINSPAQEESIKTAMGDYANFVNYYLSYLEDFVSGYRSIGTPTTTGTDAHAPLKNKITGVEDRMNKSFDVAASLIRRTMKGIQDEYARFSL